ncbi:MAG TPA: AIR synthase-related protein, partial [Candidatus Omnitrophota bacterium]|nr:AIR synthase-related protein [Candidatus Omnitrophota bacterium]
DPTRGGVSAVTNETAEGCGYSIVLFEDQIPIKPSAKNLSEILGLEPLDMANEGKMIFFVRDKDAKKALKLLKNNPLSKDSALIGEVLKEKNQKVYLDTAIGARKIVGFPVSEVVPRIC